MPGLQPVTPTAPATRRKRLLLLSHRVPFPADRGDRIRTWRLINALSERFEIHLAALADEPVTFDAWSALRSKVRRFVFEPITTSQRVRRAASALATGRSITERTYRSRRIVRTLKEWERQCRFDAALAVCSSTAPYLMNLPIPRRVADLVDLDSAKWAQYTGQSSGVKRLIYGREARRVTALEGRIARRFDAVSFVSRAEADLAAASLPAESTIVVSPNGVDPRHFAPSSISPAAHVPPRLVFTGVMNYKPNIDAMLWFTQQVWPHVLRACPAAHLDIVGRDPAPQVLRLHGRDNVRVTGAVPDVRPYLDAADIAIAPLHIARGIQNKVLEAMSMARPVVATPAAAEGIIASPGRDLITAHSARDFIKTLFLLLDHPNIAREIGRNARRAVQVHHDWGACLQPLIEALDPDAGQIGTLRRDDDPVGPSLVMEPSAASFVRPELAAA